MLDDLNDILLFAQVARTRSFTRAAAALGLPKSTVSRRIAQLEARLGARLVERTTRRVALTDAGERWAAEAERVLVAVDDARASLESLADTPRGVLRLALPVDFAIGWLATPLASFAARYPSIRLELELAPREVDLVGERFDAAIRIGALRDSSLVSRRLLTITRSLYASPLYLADRPFAREPRQLEAARWLAFPGTTALSLVCAKPNRSVNLAIEPAVHANNIGMLRALALAGAGVAVLPDVFCTVDVQSGRLARLLPAWHAAPTQASLVMPSRKLVPRKLLLLIDHLDSQLRADASPSARPARNAAT